MCICSSRGPQGFGLSVISRAGDRFSPTEAGLFVSQVSPVQSEASIDLNRPIRIVIVCQVVSGGPAMRAGLEREDRVVRINNKTPRNIQDAIEMLRKSKVSRNIPPLSL